MNWTSSHPSYILRNSKRHDVSGDGGFLLFMARSRAQPYPERELIMQILPAHSYMSAGLSNKGVIFPEKAGPQPLI
jgi:hypothetical protein